MDITEFYQAFFEEAEELLTEMEKLLLGLDVDAPDSEQLNAIFRAAHSIKGGAATFGFTALIDTTHLLENLLDSARHHQIKLHKEMINVFLETKDALQAQINAYRESEEPEAAMVEHICSVLKQLTEESLSAANASSSPAAQINTAAIVGTTTIQKVATGHCLSIRFSGVSASDCNLL
ncbi:MAG: Hpt domain-containing protein, partial [Glaciimonas sp.]|nr:Hpt domain-containing protein [Glaciimonas sp.]